MPPRMQKETLILVIDIGVTRPGVRKDSSLMEKIKFIARRIIEKKIFFRAKDEIGVILMGSSITQNALNIEHVEEFTEIQVPNWIFIEKILKLESTNYCSNWIESIYVAVEYIKENVIDSCTRKLLLLSDFKEESDIISQFQAEEIANDLNRESVKLLTIGEESLDERCEDSLSVSEVLLKDLHKKINGQHITFDNAVADLKFYEPLPVKPIAWYCTLELLDKKIPIAAYIKVTDAVKFPSWKQMKDNQNVKPVTQYLDKQRRVYKENEIGQSYKYGQDCISVGEELEKNMSYKSGIRSYKIHSFTDRNNIDLQYWSGTGTRVVVPSNDMAAKPFYSLVQALDKRNLVAIVRKVSNNNSTPKMVGLFPCIDVPDEPWCLVEIELPYAEDRRVMETWPIRSVIKQLSNEQSDAVDNLLDSLMISDSADTNQLFSPGCVPSPGLQHKWNILSYRAINPNKPLPPMEDYLKEVFEVPAIKERSRSHLKDICTLFELENVEPKAKRSHGENSKEENKGEANNDNMEQNVKTQDEKVKVDVDDDSLKESVLSLDTSDIDFDDLVANI